MREGPPGISLSIGKFCGLAELIALYAERLTEQERRELRNAVGTIDRALEPPERRGDRRESG
jgi:hypothetical protein